MGRDPRASDWINGAPRQRRYAPRSSGGCITCRRRKKRCPDQNNDVNHSTICEECYRLSLTCEWSHARCNVQSRRARSSEDAPMTDRQGKASASLSNASSSPKAPNTPFLVSTPNSVGDLTPPELDERILMSYYIHCFVPIISVTHVPTSFFTSVYIPMAFSCAAIRNAILADASAHLAKSAADDRRQALLQSSSRYQARCHNFLQERITLSGHVQKDTLESLVAILLLIGLEVQNGARTQKWINQLDCVRNVIRKHGGTAFSNGSWEAGCIYNHFLYYDVMDLIMAGVTGKVSIPINDETDVDARSTQVPHSLIPDTLSQLPWTPYLGQDRQSNVATKAFDTVHPLFGLSRELFVLMQKIRYIKRNYGRPLTESQKALFLDLESRIVTLRFDSYSHPDITGLSNLDASSRLDLLTLAETHRLAALILLYRWSEEHSDQLPILSRSILDLAERIPAGNSAEAGLTYPMFLAGAELSAEDDILRCAAKLISIRKRVNVMNIESVEKVLEAVWRERLNGGEHNDWEFLLRKWRWVINLG